MTADERTANPSSAPAHPFGRGGGDELRTALEGMLRSARGMVTFTERAIAFLDGAVSQDDRIPTRRLDRRHQPE